MYCEYYQALVNVRYTWFIGGIFRNDDALCFERTAEKNSEIIEFFVPACQEEEFLFVMQYLLDCNYVYRLEKKLNRLCPSTIE